MSSQTRLREGNYRPHCADCGVAVSARVDPAEDVIELHCNECGEVVGVGDVRFADVDLLTGGPA